MRIYWIDKPELGAIGMMPQPRCNDWLMDEISHLKKIEVDHVVSLLEAHEMEELELEMEQEYCEKQGIIFSNFPIVDWTVPSSKIALILSLKKWCMKSKKEIK